MKVLSRWATLVDDFSTSGQLFFAEVEKAVAARGHDNIVFERITRQERGPTSPTREYLRIRREHIAFDLCAAPFGSSFFFSWWLLRLGPKYPFLYIIGFLGATLLAPIAIYAFFFSTSGCLAAILAVMATFSTPLILFVLASEGFFGPPEYVAVVPWLGPLYKALFNPDTFYSLDTATMFQEAIRRDVNAILEELFSEAAVSPLSDEDWKPTLSDLLK